MKKVLVSFIKEVVDSVVSLEEAKFNPRDLEKLPDRSPDNIIDYLTNKVKLTELGMGSSRIVFLLDSKRVLKVARNEAGIGQNKAELDAVTNPSLRQVFSRIFDYNSDFSWIVSEIVRPMASKDEFEELTGFSFRIYADFLISLIESNYDFKKAMKTMVGKTRMVFNPKGDEEDVMLFNDRVNEIKRVSESPLTKGIIAAMQHGNLLLGDIKVLRHYGKSADGRVVLLDYGFTEEVADVYY